MNDQIWLFINRCWCSKNNLGGGGGGGDGAQMNGDAPHEGGAGGGGGGHLLGDELRETGRGWRRRVVGGEWVWGRVPSRVHVCVLVWVVCCVFGLWGGS